MAALAAWGLVVGAAETACVAALFLVGLSLASGGMLKSGRLATVVGHAAAVVGVEPLVFLALALLAATGVRALVSLAYERQLTRLHKRIVLSAFDTMFPGYFSMDYTAFTARNSADRTQQITQDLDRAALAVVSWVRAASLALVLILLVGLMVAVDWRAAAMGGAAALVIGGAVLPLMQWTGRVARLRRPAHADLAVAVAEPLRAYRDLATSGLWRRFYGRARSDYERYLHLSGHAAHLQAATPHALEIGVAAVVVAGIALAAALGGTATAATPVLILLVAGAYRFLPALQRLMHNLNIYKLNEPSLAATVAELNDVRGHRHPKEAQHGEPLGGALFVFDGVHFAHPGGDPVLRGATLRVGPGERIGIVGPSGIGKSTLIDLALGLLRPTAGHVRRGLGPAGRPLRIAYLPQQPAFVAGTVLDNLALADEDSVDRAEARRLLDLVGLDGVSCDLNLGEGGHGLSGGQRQRLGLARALHREPDLLLLDEPTANLDSATEQDVVQAIDRLEGLAMVVVTHREAPLSLCDRTLRFEHGHLVEDAPAWAAPAASAAGPIRAVWPRDATP